MTVDTGEFAALRAELAELTGRVVRFAERLYTVEMSYRAADAAGQDAIRGVAPIRAAQTSRRARTSRTARPRGSRSSHLRAVDGDSR